MPSSIHEALTAHALSPVEQNELYGSFLALFRRILGAEPSLVALAHLSPLTTNFFFAAMRLCVCLPWCDLGLSSLSPRQRALAMLESSLANGCTYCIAHCAVQGDVVRGTLVQQCAQNGAWQGIAEERPGDSVLKKLVREVCTLRSLSEDTRQEFVAAFGERGLTDITKILAFIAWLNAAMDVTEVRLESKLVPFAELVLRQMKMDVEFDSILAQDGERTLGEQEVRMVTGAQAATFWPRAAAWLENICQIVALVPTMWKAMAWERQCFDNIPWDVKELDIWARKQLSSTPSIFSRVSDAALKRTFALGLRELFTKGDNTNWSKFQKVAFMFVFAKGIHNQQLERDAISMAVGNETETAEKTNPNFSLESSSTAGRGEELHSTVGQRLESIFSDVCTKAEPHDAFSAATKFVHACADRAHQVPDRVKGDLLEQVKEPGSLVDLAGIIAFFSFMDRVSILVPSC